MTPGCLRTSPFLRWTDGGAVVRETVTGKSYALRPAERRLLAACAADRPLASLSAGERKLADSLRKGLLLLDDVALAGIGTTSLGSIDLEVSGSCNAECIFCPREPLRTGRGLGVMREATFQRVVEVFGAHLRFVGFCGIGEPTLHKSLPRYVRTMHDLGAVTMMVTNGSRLTDALIEALLDAGLDRIQVSFTGHVDATKASYEEHMLGLDYETIRPRVESLIRIARGRIPVSVSAVETARNRGQLAGFTDYWRARGATDAVVVPCHSRGGTILELRPGQVAVAPAVPRCGLFNVRCFVSWDGRVLACCHDIDGATALGDVATDDATSLIRRKLEVMATGQWFPVCHTCDEPAQHMTIEPRVVRTAAPRSLGR